MRKHRINRLIQSKPVQLIIRVLSNWQKDRCWDMGAALAYYAIFSLFPLLLVILGTFGFFLGEGTDINQKILGLVQSSLPPSAYDIIISSLVYLSQTSLKVGLVGLLLLLSSASGVFIALDRFADQIWQVKPRRHYNHNLIALAFTFIRQRILAFGLMLVIFGFILFSLLIEVGINVLFQIVSDVSQSVALIDIDNVLLLKGMEKSTSLILLSMAFVVLFKILPFTKVAWTDVWLGALMTSFLLMLLKYLVSNSIIQIGSQFLAYGAIGSVMILLLWIFFTCQIFLLGFEVTYGYACIYGSYRQRKLHSQD